MVPIVQAFKMAWKRYETGDLPRAEGLCRQVVQVDPGHPGARYLLGLIAARTGRNDLAIESFRAAIRLDPGLADARNNLGLALRYRGELDEAAACLREALRVRPDDAAAHFCLGLTFQSQQKLDEAAASFATAARLRPDHAESHCRLGYALILKGEPEAAEASLQRALGLKADYPEAYHSLGTALMLQGKPREAATHFQQALRLRPDHVGAHLDLGNAFREQGRLEEAAASYRQAVRLRPDHAEAHNNLGNALLELGRAKEAETHLRQALRLRPDYARAAYNLGFLLWTRGRMVEAEASYRQAVRLKPDYARAHLNLGNTLKDQGRLDEAIAAYRTAIELEPDDPGYHDTLILAMHYHPGYDQPAIRDECRRWYHRHAEPLARDIRPHANPPDPERRLRIGYVSPEFRNHIDGWLIAPLLSHHDRREFEVFCYARVTHPDAHTERLRGHADTWRDTRGLSDRQTADLVRSDRIDILVDLKVHTAGNELLVFARKPAPVQVSWLGYPGTTGLPEIDYRLTDPYLDPPRLLDAFYSEESLRLPDTFWCYEAPADGPPVNALPALQSGAITFGCLNNLCKVNDQCLSLWAEVLQAVPRSRLVLRAPGGQARDHVLAVLERGGIAAARVEFVDTRPRPEYLKLHHRIDLALDPFPYNGHTTSLDASWMGVPTLTLVGRTVVGRAGWSQLCNLGLRELAAETPGQFVTLAARLAGDLTGLAELRGTLRRRMSQSPLMDAHRFARNIEQAYRRIWRRWCEGRRQDST
jgi:protein O-GlcNAc transferase